MTKETNAAITQIAEDIFSVSIPMGPPMNQVNVYFLKDNDGWIIYDSGLNTPEAKQIFHDVFDNHLDGLPIKKLIVSHFHPDHIGLAGWICKKWQCQLYMTRTEYLMARALSLDTTEGYINGMEAYYTRAGVPRELRQHILSKGNTLAASVYPIPANYLILRENSHVVIGNDNWRVLYGRGHSTAQACLYSRKRNILLSADHVVQRITPNISVWPLETNANPLEEYLSDLKDWRISIPNDVQVLPGHGPAFTDMHARIDRLFEHHEKRLEQVVKIVEEEDGLLLHPIMERLFKPDMDARNTVFALAETHAHVNHEIYRGKIDIDLTKDQPTYSIL